jgi:hypothetical protein
VKPRAIKDLSQLNDAELLSEVSEGPCLCVGNALRLWRDARKLRVSRRAQGFEILRLFVEEEAAKFHILLDAVRCPRQPAIPDWRVLGMLLHDRVARRYFDGEVGAMNPSEADFALACKLAFYCGGDMDQMRRLFLQSALVRGKTLSPRATAGDYLGITLWNAARRQLSKGVYWVPAKPQVRRPRGGPDGRPRSVTTTAIITLRTARPELTYQGIADELDIKIETVRKAIHRMRRRESLSSSCGVVDPDPAMAKEEQAILEGKPVQEELMSYSRRYRADYAKPKGWVDIPYKPILADGVTYESNYVLPPRRKPPIRSFNIKRPLPVNMRRVA